MKTADYLTEYAPELAERISQTFVPLHIRGDRSMTIPPLKRAPLGGQEDAILAIAKTWRTGQKTVNLIGEMGTGKSFAGAAAIHTHSLSKKYRAVVMCPPHLCEKWVREIVETVPRSRVRIVERYHELARLVQYRSRPIAPEFIIISESMAKLGATWKPAYLKKPFDVLVDSYGRREYIPGPMLGCPTCGAAIKKETDGEDWEYLTPDQLAVSRHYCRAEIGPDTICGSPLFVWEGGRDRWPVAQYIATKCRGLFDYAVLDEVHEMCGSASAIAIAMSQIVQAVRYVLPLTGTYLNGYAHSIMHLLWRSSPETLAALGLCYGSEQQFAKEYGRLEKTVKSKVKAASNKESRGNAGRTTVKVLPGIMPSLFGDHLLNKSVFLNLEDISQDLPAISTDVWGVEMDCEQAAAYSDLEDRMVDAVQVAMELKDTTLLTRLVRALMDYTDYPNGYGELGYERDGSWVSVHRPPDLSLEVIRPKEQLLIDTVLSEYEQGRQCWVYCEMTQTRDVQPRLAELLRSRGLKVKVLKSQTVDTKKRDAWIAANGPGVDVMISHPGLVSTGFDLFDKRGSYNFTTLIFYQTGLKLPTLRQASRRSWRIGQPHECRVRYLYYRATLQHRFIDLMAAKLQASEAIDGKFTNDGLAALSDAGESMGIALAKSLLESIKNRKQPAVAPARSTRSRVLT